MTEDVNDKKQKWEKPVLKSLDVSETHTGTDPEGDEDFDEGTLS